MKAMAAMMAALMAALTFGTAAAAETTPRLAQMTPEKQKICEQAEERYRRIYGHPSESLKREGVVVVKMYRYTFCPPVVTVKRGMKVRWVNVDKRTSHSVWFKEAGREESARVFPDPEDVVEMTFDLPAGEYPYLCGPHWRQEGMTGKVIVTP